MDCPECGSELLKSNDFFYVCTDSICARTRIGKAIVEEFMAEVEGDEDITIDNIGTTRIPID